MRSAMNMLVALLSLALAGGAAARADDASGLDQLVHNAEYWQARSRDDKAFDAWGHVLLAEPRNPEALTSIACYEAYRGKPARARELLARLRAAQPRHSGIGTVERAIAVGPNALALLADARSLNRQKKPGAAVSKYREIFDAQEPPPYLILEFYETLSGTEQGVAEAREGLRRASQRFPSEPRYRLAYARTLTYAAQTRHEGIALLEKLESIPAVAGEAAAARRQALLWLPSLPREAELFRAWLARHPDDADIAAKIAAAPQPRPAEVGFEALRRGRTREAEEAFREATEANGDAEGLLGLATLALRREDFEGARQILERLQKAAPERPQLWKKPLATATFWSLMAEARHARAAGNTQAAEAALQRAIETLPSERVHAELALGQLYARKQPEKAEIHLRSVLAANPSHADALRELVLVLLELHRGDEARAANARLLRVDRRKAWRTAWIDSELHRRAGAEARAAGRWPEARAELEAARESDPENPWALHDLATVQLDVGDPEDARRTAEALVALDPALVSARLLEARALDALGDVEGAAAALSRLDGEQLEPDVASLKRRVEMQVDADRLAARFASGKRLVARQELVRLDRRAEGDPELQGIVAVTWARMQDQDRALSMIRQAMQHAEQPSVSLRMKLAAILLGAGEDQEFTRVMRDLEDEPVVTPMERHGIDDLRVAGTIRRVDRLVARRELPLAFAELEPVMRDRPSDPRLLCALGRLLRADGSQSEAFNVFRRVLDENPDDMEAREGAVEAAMASDNFVAAAQIAHEGLQRYPSSARAHLIAARVSMRLGDDEKAARTLREGLSLTGSAPSPNDEEAGDGAAMAPILRFAAAKFGAPPATGIGPVDPAVTSTRREIVEEMASIDSRHRLAFAGAVTLRSRSGESGLGAVSELRQPLEATIPVGWTGRFQLRATPVQLQAGSLANSASTFQRFGSLGVGTLTAPSTLGQAANGAELSLAWSSPRFTLDAGTTPLGFPLQNLVGGAEWSTTAGTIAFRARFERRAVTDSLLAYAGVMDPATGTLWGGVLRNGVRFDVATTGRPVMLYVFAGADVYTGTHVADNKEISGGAGLEMKLYDARGIVAQTGFGISSMAFEQNLRYFTFGQGGYFSPQTFVHGGIPFRFKGEGKLRWDVLLEPGLNWIRETDTLYYPLDPSLQAMRASQVDSTGSPVASVYPGQTTLGFAFTMQSKLAYDISRMMSAQVYVDVHDGQDYHEVIAGVSLTFAFGRDLHP